MHASNKRTRSFVDKTDDQFLSSGASSVFSTLLRVQLVPRVATLMMSKKRRSRKNVERVKSDDRLLWRLVTDHPDIFDTHILSKLNGNDVKFFYDVNSESRRAVKRSV